MPKPPVTFFRAERENTDKSLVAERAKATETLSSANSQSQLQTDKIVKNQRAAADQKTASSRASQDVSNAAHSDASSDPMAKAQLAEERSRTDRATGRERARMDEVLVAERNLTSDLVAKVLQRERTATDRNLLVERDTTDEQTWGSSNLLKSEVEEHKRTKGILTSREEFLAVVSHDLRNPIGAISSYAEMLLDNEGDSVLGPESQKFVRAIKRNADLSLRLIGDLMDLERIAQNKLEMNFANCDAAELVTAAIDIISPRAAELGLTVRADIPKEKLVVKCDSDRILQVLSNLLGNALKHTPSGGCIRVGLAKLDNMIAFSVSDTGPGIPEDKKIEIFGRFTQLKSNDRTGLGLGLYIAKNIVESHGGKLSLESTLGHGATFRILIPA